MIAYEELNSHKDYQVFKLSESKLEKFLLKIFFMKGSKPVKIRDNFYVRKYPVKAGKEGKYYYKKDYIVVTQSIRKGIDTLGEVVDMQSMRWLK